MKNLFNNIKNKNLWMDVFNLSTGIVLIIVLILFSRFPGNKLVISAMFILTGIMNLSNGIKKCKDKKSRSMGMALLCISIVTMFAGMVFLKLLN